MINLESRKMIYKSTELNTLKEAKERFEFLRYLEWLQDNDLGIVTYSSIDNAWFFPVTRNGQQLQEV